MQSRTFKLRKGVVFAFMMPLVVVALAVSHASYAADQSRADQSSLSTISEFSTKFCGDYWQSGGQVKFSAQAELSLNNFIKKLLSAESDANIEITRYTGVVRQHLAKELQSVRACKMVLWEDLRNLLRFRQVKNISPKHTARPSGSANCNKLKANISSMRLLSERSKTIADTVRMIAYHQTRCAEDIAKLDRSLAGRDKALQVVIDQYLKQGRCDDAARAANAISNVLTRDAHRRKITMAVATGLCR